MEDKLSEVKEAELNLKITRIQNIFEQISLNSGTTNSGQIVAFVGPTKAGKSTLINYIMGNRLKAIQDLETEDIAIDSVIPGNGPAIGAVGESETSIPKGYTTVPGTDWAMWDFPGFGDNKGTEQEIANAAAYERILRQQETVRFVLVVPSSMINDDNPMQFFKLLNDIASICPNYSDSLSLIATKTIKGNVAPRLKKLMKASFLKADEGTRKIVSKSKEVIVQLLMNNRCADFRAPEMDEGVETLPLKPTDLPVIVEVIKAMKGSKVSPFPLVISEVAKYEILLLYTSFYRGVKEEVEKMCSSFVNFIQHKTNETMDNATTSAQVKLSIYKATSKKILFIKEQSNNFRGFLNIIKNFGFQVSHISSMMSKYLFIEKIRNMYKTEKTQDGRGEEEFYKRVMLTVNHVAQIYSDLIGSSEAASAEEKRHERELKEVQEQERIRLEEDLRRLEEENESVLVQAAKYISKNFVNPMYKFVAPVFSEIFNKNTCTQQ